MTFKNLKELNTTESRSCALVFNFNNKELIKIKSVFRLSGISDIIILKNDNLNTTIKDILDDNLLEDSEEKINSRAIIFNNIESRKISAVSDNLIKLKINDDIEYNTILCDVIEFLMVLKKRGFIIDNESN